jgi:17beta-estradiol 17-dehydrogenase / very-long-chain 3-oxoacyl-CoA reductase
MGHPAHQQGADPHGFIYAAEISNLYHSIPVPLVVALALVGLLFISTKIFGCIRLLFSLFVLPGKSVSSPRPEAALPPSTPSRPLTLHRIQLRSFGPKGSWALVTGASDGIGKEFSLQLARAGFNVLLVSRTEAKLAALASAIASDYAVQTRILAMDYAADRDADYEALGALAHGLDIAILINNVGRSHDIPVAFAETDPSEMRDIITINCFGTLRTTALVLPGMMARKRGLILTMGSFGGLLPTPLLATYSGSKAFLQQWSSALGAELAPYNIAVELVQSYLVTSAMSKIRRASATIPTPRAFVKAVLSRLGRSGGAQGWAYTSTPFWSHAFMQWGLSTFIGVTGKVAVGRNLEMHKAIRRKALRKREREAKKE